MAEKDEALERAIKAVGTGQELAAKLGITPQALSQWDKIPLDRVPRVSEVTGIPCHELRGDIFPAPPGLQKEDAA